MQKSIESKLGTFIHNEHLKSFKLESGPIHWSLNENHVSLEETIKRAETLFSVLEEFNIEAKIAIAKELIVYKNEFWPEYDEDDETLDWDAVDAGAYDTTLEEFCHAITLLDIEINEKSIYLEYDDGDLFGGHRIHATFDYDYKLLKAAI
ncbi:DUF2262 domain-containing protein [Lederbergia lenta]|uniref:Group-specific protein n=1 Tax=Lederbergia lenta TaxID=1467 RepID=A0A2X4VZQ4_LEDLE|nr:DUF2262 domain-containing protein [Lederbergia lenta]MEC2326061.1 DUF2262 domain-containing protein [Lederbergia lenta]SQI53298.1 group-specific protein [Lederbergia lenta]